MGAVSYAHAVWCNIILLQSSLVQEALQISVFGCELFLHSQPACTCLPQMHPAQQHAAVIDQLATSILFFAV